MAINFKRHLWVSGLIIVGSLLVATIALYFLSGNIAMTAGKISSDRSLINKETGTLAVLANLKKQAPQAAAYQAAMEDLLPTQDGLIGLGAWLNAAAATNGVSITFSFGDSVAPPSDTAFGTADFSFTATGALPAIAAFLNQIENSDPGFLIAVDSFDIVTSNGGYTLTGQGDAFFRS